MSLISGHHAHGSHFIEEKRTLRVDAGGKMGGCRMGKMGGYSVGKMG